MTKGSSTILRIYFALVTFVTLMMLIFSVSDLINIALKTWVFTAADAPEWFSPCDEVVRAGAEEAKTKATERCQAQEEREKEAAVVRKQQSAVRDIAMILVAAPLFWLHWRVVYRDWMEEKKTS
jgi:hypothetical protein